MIKRVLFFFIILSVGILLFGYNQSTNFKNQGDLLVKQGRVGEAIILYNKARSIFPLRSDVTDNLEAANLILQSDLTYETISDLDFAEVQIAPDLPAIGALQPNEVFVPILMYHHIDVNPKPEDPVWASLFVTSDQLNSQLEYLTAHGYTSITLDELYAALNNKATLPKQPIVLTFDDGYRTFYTNAYPLLKKYNVKATEFVITQVEGAPAYLTWDQILEMDKSGLVRFGAHTRHHPNLPDLSQTSIINEVQGSKSDLEDHLKKEITWFAYPYGGYTNSVVEVVRNAGFKGAVSTIYGAGQSSSKLYIEPRIMVDGRYSLANFIARIQK